MTQRFSSEELVSWNLLTRTNNDFHYISLKLTMVYGLGVLVRYCILAPLRFPNPTYNYHYDLSELPCSIENRRRHLSNHFKPRVFSCVIKPIYKKTPFCAVEQFMFKAAITQWKNTCVFYFTQNYPGYYRPLLARHRNICCRTST